jgi:hypothetical protein
MFIVPPTRALVIHTPGLRNSSSSSKIYLISTLEVKKRRCRYAIYNRIEVNSYYGYRNEKDGILEKVKQSTKEEMQGRALRKW